MLSNDRPKVAIIWGCPVGFESAKLVETSHGPACMVPYESFHALFTRITASGVQNFITLDQDRFISAREGAAFKDLNPTKRVLGFDKEYLNRHFFWIKVDDQYYGLT